MDDVTEDVLDSIRLKWFFWMAASFNLCQSVHSKQPYRTAEASSVHTDCFYCWFDPLNQVGVSRLGYMV